MKRTARDLIDDEMHRARREAETSRGTARDQFEADASTLADILLALSRLRDSRTRTLEQANGILEKIPDDIEWMAIRDASTQSLEMLDRLGASQDHDDMVAAGEDYVALYLKDGNEEADARERLEDRIAFYANTGMTKGAIAQRLRYDTKLYGSGQ